ncbi:unnamed protein product, partial [Adineta steineri]
MSSSLENKDHLSLSDIFIRRIVKCENEHEQKVFSNKSRITESIFKCFHNNHSIKDLFLYGLSLTNRSPFIFLQQIHFHQKQLL